jgi:ATP-dependent DNA helicase RecG
MTANTALDRLRKILKLEQQLGYRNKAVIGGLERLSERWRADAERECTIPAQRASVERIVAELNAYSALPAQPARRQAIESLLATIDKWPTAADMAAPTAAAWGAEAEAETGPIVEEEYGDFVLEEALPVAAQAARPAPSPPPLPPPSAIPSRPTPVGSANLQASVSRLPGVGPGYTKRLAKMGIHTIGDLLWLLPRRYDDYTSLKSIVQLRHGEEVTIIANLWDIKSRRLPGRNATLITGLLGDSTATIEVTWFNPYVARQLATGKTYVFSGRVDSYLGKLVMRNPEWEPLDREQVHTGRMSPVYPLTKGLNMRWMRNLQKQVVDSWGRRVHDHLPEDVRRRVGLMSLGEALEQVHFPASQAQLKDARRRLAFDELFLIQIGVLRQRKNWVSLPAQPFPLPDDAQHAFVEALPYQYTNAQQRALRAILDDMAQSQPMSRLVQGDVGSGKTVVAANAMWGVVVNGAQASMMAPTEILAEQHYRNLSRLFEQLQWQGRPVRVALLTGSQKASDRQQTLRALAAGEVDIAVGTHALIQEGVEFRRLGLAIIDEQHRFGVRQRATLRQKGVASDGSPAAERGVENVPHLLVMSATPIPRTLSLTVFGDLDASVIDEMPPGRQPIKTRWLLPRERERAFSFLRRQVQAGRQGFIVYPLVEESESSDVQAAVPQYEQLCKEVFPDLRLGLLHGRLKGQEKDAVMQAMQRGDIDILVATSVVEVGIDIPNATIMVVEDAERFGLAQLHQFRGRVGRGEHASYCILISDATTPSATERLHALEEIQDGFELAEKDLQLRGPGDFFGTRQSGLPDLKMAQLSDLRTLEQARAEAAIVLDRDPDLTQPEHLALGRKVYQFWQGEGDIS